MVETIKTYAGSDVSVSQCLVTLESFIGDTNEQELDDGTVLDASDAVTAINGLIWSMERREGEIDRISKEFEIARTASRLFEQAANDWQERALKAEAALQKVG